MNEMKSCTQNYKQLMAKMSYAEQSLTRYVLAKTLTLLNSLRLNASVIMAFVVNMAELYLMGWETISPLVRMNCEDTFKTTLTASSVNGVVDNFEFSESFQLLANRYRVKMIKHMNLMNFSSLISYQTPLSQLHVLQS